MAVSIVQEPAGLNVNNATSISKAFTSNVTNGNLIVVGCARGAAGGATLLASDCTKSAGTATIGTITIDKETKIATAGPTQVGIWSIPITGNGSATIAVAGAAGSFFILAMGEYTGIDVSGTRVENTNSNTAVAATTPITTGNATSTGGLFFAATGVDSSSSTVNTVVGNSFTQLFRDVNASTDQTGEIDRLISTGATTQGTWTVNTTSLHGWGAVVVAYKAAAGAVTPTVTLSNNLLMLMGVGT